MESGKLKNVAHYHHIVRHAELVSASVDFEISTLNEFNNGIHHDTDAETSSA